MPTPKVKGTLKKPLLKTSPPLAPISSPWHYEKQPEVRPAEPPMSTPTILPSQPTDRDFETTKPRSSAWIKLQALAIFLFPFVIWPWSIVPLEFSKQTYLAFLVGLTLLGVLINSWRKGNLDLLPRHLALFTGLAALLSSTISTLRSGMAPLGIFGYGGAEALSLSGLALLSLWLLLIFQTGKLGGSRVILYALMASGSILSLITLLSLFGLNIYSFVSSKGFNPAGTTTAAHFVGLVSLLLALGFWLNNQSKRVSLIYVLAMLPPLALLFGSGFRAPLIATAVGLLVLLIFQLRQGNPSSLKLTSLILGLIITIVLIIWPFTALLQTPLEVGPSHRETWTITQQVLKEHPVLGSGPASFSTNYLRFRSLPILKTPFWNISFDWGSSTVLTSLANLGWLGGGLMLISLVFVIVWYAVKLLSHKPAEGSSPFSGTLLAVSIAMLVGAALSPMLFTPQFFFATILGLMLANYSRPFALVSRRATPQITAPLVGSIAILLILLIFVLQGRRVAAETLAYQGTRLAQKNPAAQAKIGRAIGFDRWNDVYLRILAELQRSSLNQKISAASTNPDPQGLIQEIRTLADGALNTARAATTLFPKNVANWVTLGNVYLDISPITSGTGQAAVEAFTKALELSPADPSLMVNLGVARAIELRTAEESTKQELETEATKVLTRALEIRPTYPLGHLELARLYAASGKTDEALAAYRNVELLLPQDPALRYEIANFLLQKDRRDEARAELEAAIQISPNFSNARWFLAELYEEQGQLEKAVEQIKKVIELNPENQQAKERLEELQKKIK